jgi:hypothetical protein
VLYVLDQLGARGINADLGCHVFVRLAEYCGDCITVVQMLHALAEPRLD